MVSPPLSDNQLLRHLQVPLSSTENKPSIARLFECCVDPVCCRPASQDDFRAVPEDRLMIQLHQELQASEVLRAEDPSETSAPFF
jgi:hypothetical protein